MRICGRFEHKIIPFNGQPPVHLIHWDKVCLRSTKYTNCKGAVVSLHEKAEWEEGTTNKQYAQIKIIITIAINMLRTRQQKIKLVTSKSNNNITGKYKFEYKKES